MWGSVGERHMTRRLLSKEMTCGRTWFLQADGTLQDWSAHTMAGMTNIIYPIHFSISRKYEGNIQDLLPSWNIKKKKKRGICWYNPTQHLPAASLFILCCTVVCNAATHVYFTISFLQIKYSIPSFRLINMVPFPGIELGSTTPIRDCSLQSLVSADVGECGWETHNQEAAQQGDDLWTDLSSSEADVTLQG